MLMPGVLHDWPPPGIAIYCQAVPSMTKHVKADLHGVRSSAESFIKDDSEPSQERSIRYAFSKVAVGWQIALQIVTWK